MRGFLLPFCVAVSACAHAQVPSVVDDLSPWPGTPGPTPVPAAAPDETGARLAAHAARLVGLPGLAPITTAVPDDCSGLVRHVYGLEGIDLMGIANGRTSNASAAIWMAAQAVDAVEEGRPEPGDLLFFRRTYDRDHDGRPDDGMTHVAIVESIDPDGTLTFIHRSGQGITRSRMNLGQPHERNSPEGAVINDFLRPRARTWAPAFAAELFAGAASASRLRLGLADRGRRVQEGDFAQ